MNEPVAAELMMVAGSLHDLAELSREESIKRKIEDIEKRLESIINKYATYINHKNLLR